MSQRRAAIDIGTNSVLLVIAERNGDALVPLLERAEIVRLGEGVDKTGVLSDGAISRTLAALEQYAEAINAHGAPPPVVIATSASRDASNAKAFTEPAERILGAPIRVISGEEEAAFVVSGVRSSFPEVGEGDVVFDIGGGSTEFIRAGADGAVHQRVSLNIGTVRFTERFIASDPPSADELAKMAHGIRDALTSLPETYGGQRLWGVAGTVTTMVTLRDRIDPYDSDRVNGATLSLAEIDTLLETLRAQPLHQRRELPGLQPKRADVIIAGAALMAEILRHFGQSGTRVCDRGVRWGAVRQAFETSSD